MKKILRYIVKLNKNSFIQNVFLIAEPHKKIMQILIAQNTEVKQTKSNV